RPSPYYSPGRLAYVRWVRLLIWLLLAGGLLLAEGIIATLAFLAVLMIAVEVRPFLLAVVLCLVCMALAAWVLYRLHSIDLLEKRVVRGFEVRGRSKIGRASRENSVRDG